MELEIKRLGGNSDTSMGAWYIGEGVSKYLFCHSVEDERRHNKIDGKTRIPAGRYEIVLNHIGGMNKHYSKYPWHIGMLELADVPNFSYVYIHPGNTHSDTEGCLLPNYKSNLKDMCGENSFECYKDLYLEIVPALKNNEQVFITIKDEDL